MQKLVDGKLVDLTTAEASACEKDRERGKIEALTHVKRSVIERIDARLEILIRRTRMADTKAQIMAAKSVEEVRKLFDAVKYELPAMAVGGGVTFTNYDDSWIKEQMGTLAEALRHLDEHGTKFVTETLAKIEDALAKIEALEQRVADVERIRALMPSKEDFLEDGLTFPEVGEADALPEEVPHVPRFDWKLAKERVDQAEAEEAGADVSELPPIEVPEPEPEPAPIELTAPVPAPALPPPDPVVLIDNSIKQQIRYEVAMRAVNGSVKALQLLSLEAAKRGLATKDLAHLIVRERDDQEVAVMREFALNV